MSLKEMASRRVDPYTGSPTTVSNPGDLVITQEGEIFTVLGSARDPFQRIQKRHTYDPETQAEIEKRRARKR